MPGAVGQVTPVRIGPGEVAIEDTELALTRLKQQRQVTGLQALLASAGHNGQATGLNLRMQGGQVVLAKGGGAVHGGFSWRDGAMLGRILA